MELSKYDFTFKAMASSNELSFYAESIKSANSIAKAAISAVDKLEQKYSRYLPGSLLTKINESAGNAAGTVENYDECG